MGGGNNAMSAIGTTMKGAGSTQTIRVDPSLLLRSVAAFRLGAALGDKEFL